ncbi:MAG TPA: alpha-galactoside-binding protein, partial [Agrobacterium sp.]|nr:alpha-galactoside-binding protein [Agrobacterium sp.]
MLLQRRIGIISALGFGVSMIALNANAFETTTPPEPPQFPAEGKINYVARDSILEFKALPSYSEPDWITEKFEK